LIANDENLQAVPFRKISQNLSAVFVRFFLAGLYREDPGMLNAGNGCRGNLIPHICWSDDNLERAGSRGMKIIVRLRRNTWGELMRGDALPIARGRVQKEQETDRY